MVVLGLGFVIFIHELGHFLAAKWCDVHVQTFSIGFGPALPGCSFQRGETTYKLAVLPLGGYVNMVGEGPEADEDEDYPRSFKNKTVGQRMLIISAGVIMNVLFGALCFIVVYRYHGVDRPPAVVWTRRSRFAGLAGRRPPRLENRRDRRQENRLVRRHEGEGGVVGRPAAGLRVRGPRRQRLQERHRAAARRQQHDAGHRRVARRAIEALSAGVSQVSVAAGAVQQRGGVGAGAGPGQGRRGGGSHRSDDGQGRTLAPRGEGLGRTVRASAQGPRQADGIEGARAGKKAEETVSVPAVGFEFGDWIVGTTDPRTPDEPFNIKPLPLDASRDSRGRTKSPTRSPTATPGPAGRQADGRPGGPLRPPPLRRPPRNRIDAGEHPGAAGLSRESGDADEMGKVATIREDSPADEGRA